ncbi:ATP-binding protein [Telmatospirillum sp. J64-1]|uniref:PAS domain-containing sensor histidine kinase n=1 Tax=Telmatospirillum sp. J64-1 TaxID=2502183 RepID=UPI00115EC8E6|nr:ATP-binding protein [Telmatospirillum sp. J64-1]
MSDDQSPKQPPFPGDVPETAWIEVIQKMEEVYSDLIRYEVDLEQKNAALEEAQQFITSVVSSVSDILIVCDQKGRVQQVNRALVELTGFDESAFLDRPVRDLFVDDATLPAGFCEQMAELQQDGVTDLEVRLHCREGTPSDPVAINCSTRFDTRGRPAGLVLIGRPVGELRRAYQALNAAHAELKQAQQQLVQSEKMASLGRLVAGVAHELNNPISFVYGNVHSLARYRERLTTYLEAIHAGIPEEEREDLRRKLRIDRLLSDLGPLIEGTLEGAVRVADIVKNLRRLSFSSQGEPERLDVSAVIGTAVQWAAKGRPQAIPIHCRLPPGLSARGHAGQLHQVMVNLIENALDAVAGQPSPEIRVMAESGPDWVWVTVEDNGPGIPPENVLKVFDPFFTTKPVGHGTGLGLWISYGIIKDHGGMIEAGNIQSPDGTPGGARFRFSLPAA